MPVELATFKPAIEEFELRTLLLIGEFGNAPNDEPIEVEIIGDLKTRDGQNLKGQKVSVTPLEEGPFLSYAEFFNFEANYPNREKVSGFDCPKTTTKMVVRTVWAGGVRAINGKELGDNELNNFTITMLRDKDTIKVHPFHIADVGDNDNNIDLWLKDTGIPLSVEVKENIAIDPRDDKNPLTKKNILSRW